MEDDFLKTCRPIGIIYNFRAMFLYMSWGGAYPSGPVPDDEMTRRWVVKDDNEDEGGIALIDVIQLKGVARKLKTSQKLQIRHKLGLIRCFLKNPYRSLGSRRGAKNSSIQYIRNRIWCASHLKKIHVLLKVPTICSRNWESCRY